MAQVAVADVSFDSADSTTLDITHVVAAGEVLIVGVILEVTDGGKEVDSVTWSGDEGLSQFTAFNPTHGKLRIEVFTLTNPTAETGTLNVTLLSSQKFGAMCISVTNTNTITPLSAVDTDEGNSSTGSVSVTQAANDLAFCFAGFLKTSSTFTPGGGETEHVDVTAAGQFDMWAASEDGAAATTLSWTHGGGSAENATVGFLINEQTRRIFIT